MIVNEFVNSCYPLNHKVSFTTAYSPETQDGEY